MTTPHTRRRDNAKAREIERRNARRSKRVFVRYVIPAAR